MPDDSKDIYEQDEVNSRKCSVKIEDFESRKIPKLK